MLSTLLRPARDLILTLATLAATLPALALTLTPVDTGTVTRITNVNTGVTYSHSPASTSTVIGVDGGFPDTLQYRAFALYTLPSNLQTPVSARLQMSLLCVGSCTAGTAVSVGLRGIGLPASAFQVTYSGSTSPAAQALYDGLASGTAYGSGSSSSVVPLTGIDLNAAALAAIMAAGPGGTFGIAFADGVADSASGPQPLVGITGVIGGLQLVITTVPEPGPALLLATGVAVLSWRGRRA